MNSQRVSPCADQFNPDSDKRFLESSTAPSTEGLETEVRTQIENIFQYLNSEGRTSSFHSVEKSLIGAMFMLGRLFLSYFLALRHAHSQSDIAFYRKQGFRMGKPQPRKLGTRFGEVNYWRTYMRGNKGGVYPLDLVLGLTRDKFTKSIVSTVAFLSTHLPFDLVAEFMIRLSGWSPSKTSIEKAVIGLGHYTEEWFEHCPAPENDGQVLVIQIDSKATPTATEEELKKRRGKRKKRKFPKSSRHRGRVKRKALGPKKKRKKGDKSKNGKAATIVVMYTLKSHAGPKGKKIVAWAY